MKTCTVCGQSKELSAFGLKKSHNGKRYTNGLCRACGIVKAKQWAKANPEKRKAIWKRHAEKNREKVASSNRAYYQRHRDRRLAAMYEYWRLNPEKRSARKEVHKALLRGDLKRKPCEECGSIKRVQAHHHDYSKPLDVKWLCTLCHGKEHRAA